MKNFILFISLCLLPFVSSVVMAEGINVSYSENSECTLFDNPTTYNDLKSYYRIPAITLMNNGTLLGFCDIRIGGTGDIGGGEAISILSKTSSDNGKTWSEQNVAVAGGGEGFDFAHGDAAVVTDRETGKMILLCASGDKGYSTGGCMIGRYYSTDGVTWSGGEITDSIKTAFNAAGLSVTRQFFTSGRMIQSSKVKIGGSYRIYSALCTNSGSIVMYSDDFGTSWSVLGGTVACSGGDETVLEELPNGDLLLSARLSVFGRKFNVFKYSNLTSGDGAWNDTIAKGLTDATNCNAEMLLLPTKKSNIFILLHSVSLSGRKNVTIYYKVIDTNTDDYTSSAFYADGWNVLHQMSETTSCYSTMVRDKDGNVAYLFEENSNGGYDIQYRNFTVNIEFTDGIKEITRDDINGVVCNLSGQRVNADTTGILIKDSRKFVKK